MTRPLIRIVDDDPALGESFALLLATMGWDVARYADGQTFLAEDSLEGPGCIVLDVRMPGMTGLEVQAELERRGCRLPILFLSAHGTISMAVHTLQHGAADFLEKPVDPMAFLQKVSRAVSASVDEHVQAREQENKLERFQTLTPREHDIVAGVLEGKANKVIARDLGLEVSTVKMHRANAFAKLGVHSPAELTRLAFETGYADATQNAR